MKRREKMRRDERRRGERRETREDRTEDRSEKKKEDLNNFEFHHKHIDQQIQAVQGKIQSTLAFFTVHRKGKCCLKLKFP